MSVRAAGGAALRTHRCRLLFATLLGTTALHLVHRGTFPPTNLNPDFSNQRCECRFCTQNEALPHNGPARPSQGTQGPPSRA